MAAMLLHVPAKATGVTQCVDDLTWQHPLWDLWIVLLEMFEDFIGLGGLCHLPATSSLLSRLPALREAAGFLNRCLCPLWFALTVRSEK